MKLIDLHNHTNFSYDGISGINSLVENAIRNGVSILGITDHEFSIGDRIDEYIDAVNYAKEQYKGKITLLLGLEIGTRPYPEAFNPEITKNLDFCLFESLDDSRAMDFNKFLDWRKNFHCPQGLAHTDIFKLSERYNTDILSILKKENIFWEINFSGNYNYYFDLISNREKQDAVKKSGIALSVGSDTHWVGDFDKKRLVQTNELVRSLKNPLALGIRDYGIGR
ncbi:MAG: PHP domain-containing protein [Clostridia bacterium]|nr:PHP domain-containing protein [Clostridia bacterium]